MATQEKWNNAPPQNLIIAACALLSVLVLFSLKFGFDAYSTGCVTRRWTIASRATPT